MMLTSSGYQVTATVTKGEGAIQAIDQTPPDLVLMDINLKGQMDDVQAACPAWGRQIDAPA